MKASKILSSQAQSLVADLDPAWAIDAANQCLVRRFEFKGYAKVTYFTGLCIWLADKTGHHPDVSFGWGYVEIRLTTHDVDGLSQRDFDWADQLDSLLALR